MSASPVLEAWQAAKDDSRLNALDRLILANIRRDGHNSATRHAKALRVDPVAAAKATHRLREHGYIEDGK